MSNSESAKNDPGAHANPYQHLPDGDPDRDLAEADKLWSAIHEAQQDNAGKDATPEPEDAIPSSREVTRDAVSNVLPLDITALQNFITANRNDIEMCLVYDEKSLLISTEKLIATELNNFFAERNIAKDFKEYKIADYIPLLRQNIMDAIITSFQEITEGNIEKSLRLSALYQFIVNHSDEDWKALFLRILTNDPHF